jgi:hypothetical protein
LGISIAVFSFTGYIVNSRLAPPGTSSVAFLLISRATLDGWVMTVHPLATIFGAGCRQV